MVVSSLAQQPSHRGLISLGGDTIILRRVNGSIISSTATLTQGLDKPWRGYHNTQACEW